MKTFLCSIFLSLTYIINAQTIRVIDKTDLQPIENVVVTDENKKDLGKTDAKGEITLENGVKGVLLFTHPNYQLFLVSLETIKANNNIVALSPQVIRLDEAVVSASRFEEKKGDVPKKVDVITARDIEKTNAQSTADLLQQSGNVNVQKSQQGGGSPQIRGFETNRVLIVVDGIRMNNAIYRAGHLQNVIRFDNNSLEKLEVVYGPGSVMYGSDALGGVMHFYTKAPVFGTVGKNYFNATAFTRFSTANNEKAAHVDFTLGTEKISSMTSFTYDNFGDLRQGAVKNPAYGTIWKKQYYVERFGDRDSMINVYSNGIPKGKGTDNIQTQSGYTQFNLIEKLAFKTKNGGKHMINFQYSSTGDVYRYDRLTDFSGGNLKYAEWYYGPEKHMITAYQFSSGKSTKLYDKMNISLAWQDLQESRVNRKFNNNNRRHQIEDVDVYNLNVDMMKVKGKHEMRYGLEGGYNIVNSTAYSENISTNEETPVSSRYPDGGSTYMTLGAYFTHTMEINEKLILTDGIRFNYVGMEANFKDTSLMHFPFTSASQKNSSVNGSLGLIFNPTKDWRFTLLASSGFRAPNVDDLGKVFDSSPGILIVPNLDIKPENTYNVELGIQKSWNGVSIAANGFYTLAKDLITVQKFTFEGSDSIVYDGTPSAIYAAQNNDNAYIYGANFELRADINEKFSFYTTLNYTYGRLKTDTTDTPLDHIPPVFGKTSFQYNLKKFSSEFYVVYNGWKRLKDYSVNGEDNLNYATPVGMPAWYTLNIRTSYQISKNIKLQVAMENITDLNYRVFASGISAPGRNFIISLRGNF